MQGLLTQVAHDSSGRQWQHLSDLTRRYTFSGAFNSQDARNLHMKIAIPYRNYRAHLRNNVPKISLVEWQAKSLRTHKRFEKVQKIFERSSIS